MTALWFQEGLKFKCTGCGGCCTGTPGYVYLSEREVLALAEHKGLPLDEFKERFTRDVGGSLALIDAPGTHDCVFLKDKACQVYEARPVQCRTFPWWIHNLRSEEDWLEAGKSCEGINHPDAPTVPFEQIEAECLTYLDTLIEQNFTF